MIDLDDYKKIKVKAIRLLSLREYSVSNLKKKLCDYAHLFSPAISLETVELVIIELKKNNWVSDERAVDSLINQKISRCGALRLKMELNKLGVENKLIENSLNKIKSSEYKRAFELLVKRYKHAPINLKEIISQKNFLMRRGFDFDVCRKAVDNRSNQLNKELFYD